MRSDSPHDEKHSEENEARQRLLAAMPLTERRIRLGGVPTTLLEGGEGPPIVFLQGEFAAVWVRVIPDLVRTHRVIVPDLPGQGASGMPPGQLDREAVLTWLGELIDQTCPEPPALVGKGVGGAVAARFAARHSDRLDRLVLVNSLGLGRFRPPPRMALSYLGVLVRPTEPRVERSFRNYCFVDLDQVQADMGDLYQSMLTYALDRFGNPGARRAMRHLFNGFSSAIAPEDLARITVPTCLIWGREDLGAPLELAEAASARYGWTLQIIDDARDDPALEQPAAFLQALHSAVPRQV